MNLQYELKVTNGTKELETGHFFIAAPFYVSYDSVSISVVFTRHNVEHVSYQLLHEGQSLGILSFPDYAPECTPEDLMNHFEVSFELAPLFDALVYLKICSSTSFKAYFSDDYKSSFTVQQPKLFVNS